MNFIKFLGTQNNQINMVAFDGVVSVSKGQQLTAVLKNWGYQYIVEFQIIIHNNPPHYLNVFHLSIENDCCEAGTRIPALFVHNDNYFLFTSSSK